MFDTIQRLGAIFRPCGDSRNKLGRLEKQGGRNHLYNIGGFFVSASGLQLVAGCGSLRAAGSLLSSRPTYIQPPFSFGREKGEQPKQGGSPMSKSPQGSTAQNTDVKKLIEKVESMAAIAVEVLNYQQALFESIAKQNGEHTTTHQLANIGVLLVDTHISTFEAELAALQGVAL